MQNGAEPCRSEIYNMCMYKIEVLVQYMNLQVPALCMLIFFLVITLSYFPPPPPHPYL